MATAPRTSTPLHKATGLVEVVVEEPGWTEALPALGEIAERAAAMALEGAGLRATGYEIALLACGDGRIAELNTTFRDKPAATNVLSWPALPLAPSAPGSGPPAPPRPRPGAPLALGDVAIALETCLKEAEAARRPLKDHVLHLILHGCLHLLGYDHETEADAAVMEGIERRAFKQAGLPDPYDGGDADDGPPAI